MLAVDLNVIRGQTRPAIIYSTQYYTDLLGAGFGAKSW